MHGFLVRQQVWFCDLRSESIAPRIHRVVSHLIQTFVYSYIHNFIDCVLSQRPYYQNRTEAFI